MAEMGKATCPLPMPNISGCAEHNAGLHLGMSGGNVAHGFQCIGSGVAVAFDLHGVYFPLVLQQEINFCAVTVAVITQAGAHTSVPQCPVYLPEYPGLQYGAAESPAL